MADILKNNVQAYVRELIAKAFESSNNKDKSSSDKRNVNKSEQWNAQNRPIWRCSSNSK